MRSINSISEENFNNSFNLEDVLQESVFYPASGIDGTPIEVFANKYKSFINVDYSLKYEEVKDALENNFSAVGYKLIGLKDILKEELTPYGISVKKYELNNHEKDRLNTNDQIRDLYNNAGSSGFALWAVYELDSNLTQKIEGKAERFSILHIRGEGWATFEALYVHNGINPKAITIINPGEGYGDNWTKFTDYKFRFYQSVRNNVDDNGAKMPEYILTNATVDEDGYFWGDFAFTETFPILNCSLYQLENNLY